MLYSTTSPMPRTIEVEKLRPLPAARILPSSIRKSDHAMPSRCAIVIKHPTVVLATGRTISGGIKSQERIFPAKRGAPSQCKFRQVTQIQDLLEIQIRFKLFGSMS